jgi:radical SAM protein with 4Fe4S-binding SPASM domain
MYLILYFQGEPLLNPAFFEMASYAKEKGIYTATSTNGHFLTDENARKIIESGLNRLIISLDGADQETYEQYRRGGDLNMVFDGIGKVVRLKKEMKSSTPYVIIQFLVFKNNEHQIPAMKTLAKELGADKLELKTAQIYDYENDTSLIPDHPKYARYIKDGSGKWKLKKAIHNRCFRMWSGAVITWDGRVVPCCFDKDATHQFGKLETHSFKKIWKSKSYKEFRKQVFTDRNKIDICQNCTE